MKKILTPEYMPEFDAGLLKYKGNTRRMRYIMRYAHNIKYWHAIPVGIKLSRAIAEKMVGGKLSRIIKTRL